MRSGRIAAAVCVAAIHLVIGYAFLMGMTVSRTEPRDEKRSIIVLEPEPVPPPVAEPPPKQPKVEAKGGGAPVPKAPPLPVIVPKPVIVTTPPPVIAVAPPTVTSGASPVMGEGGTGSGGQGDDAGPGAGQGEEDGEGFTGARQIRGRFRNSDFPPSARSAGRLRIGVQFAVGPTGRVEECDIIEPSGYPEVDAMTCRVIIDRYRFKPARDPQGDPVTEVMEEEYTWTLD